MIHHDFPQIPLQNFLCLDVGTKKTGIANNFANNKIAFPIETIPTQDILEKIVFLTQNHSFSVVVGLPMAYSEGESFFFITNFVEFLQKNLPKMDFIFWDEAGSSDVVRKLHKFGRKGFSKKFHENYDMKSASVILSDFLMSCF
jgi:RNase H-fold protein (predicted Holliday junction resolvase)